MRYALYLNSNAAIKSFCRDRICGDVWNHCNCSFPYDEVSEESPLRVILTCKLLKKVFGFRFESLPDDVKAPFMLDRDIGIQRYSFGQALFLWACVQFSCTQAHYIFSCDDIEQYEISFIPSNKNTIIEIESKKDCSKLLQRLKNQEGISDYKLIIDAKQIA